jgi:hypothetical protein
MSEKELWDWTLHPSLKKERPSLSAPGRRFVEKLLSADGEERASLLKWAQREMAPSTYQALKRAMEDELAAMKGAAEKARAAAEVPAEPGPVHPSEEPPIQPPPVDPNNPLMSR